MQKTIKEHILAAAASFGEAVASSDLVEEAVRRTGTSEATVRNQLTDLKRRGLLIQPRHGYYQLPATSEIKELIKKEEGRGQEESVLTRIKRLLGVFTDDNENIPDLDMSIKKDVKQGKKTVDIEINFLDGSGRSYKMRVTEGD